MDVHLLSIVLNFPETNVSFQKFSSQPISCSPALARTSRALVSKNEEVVMFPSTYLSQNASSLSSKG